MSGNFSKWEIITCTYLIDCTRYIIASLFNIEMYPTQKKIINRRAAPNRVRYL